MSSLWPLADPSSIPRLAPGGAHVYFLPEADGALARLHGLLSVDERERAARFLVEPPRRQFISAHGQMRLILNGYAKNGDIFGANGDQAPETHSPNPVGDIFRFETLAQGKPFLVGSRLSFNLSHTGGAALLAVALDLELGVDIERLDRTVDYAQIAPRFFAPSEAEKMMALPPDQRQAAFFRCWTRKEAYIKAVGGGLSIPLDSFTVSFAPGEPPALHAPQHPNWTLYALEPHPEYAAALVASMALEDLRCWTWTG